MNEQPEPNNENEKPNKPRRRKGIAHSAPKRQWKERKGGKAKKPDFLDRSEADHVGHFIDRWLADMAVTNYTPRTIQTRKRDVIEFASWAQDRELKRVPELTRAIVESYQRHLHRHRKRDGSPLSAASQVGRLRSVKAWFRWLCQKRIIEANPASALQMPREPKQLLPKALDPAQVDAVMAVPDVTDPLGVRNRAILELLYSTGIRRSEVANLELSDLQTSQAILTVIQGKGRKDRVVPVGDCALAWVERYLDECRPILVIDPGERGLFLTGFGTPFSPDTMGNLVRRIMREAGIEEGGAHLLRHSCATHMLANGAELRYIGQLLGHASMETTAIYTEVAIAQLKEVHRRTHPSSKRPGER